MDQSDVKDWHLLVDKFAFYGDENALSLISEEVTNKEIQQYLFTFHNETISLEDIEKWRIEHVGDQ